MVYGLKTTVFVLAALITAGSGSAWSNGKSFDERAAVSAKELMEKALVSLEDRMAYCEDNQEPLDMQVLRELGLDEQQTYITLVYFHQKTQNECIERDAKHFLAAARTLFYAQQAVPALGESETDTGVLVDKKWWEEMQAEAMYEKVVPASTRAKIGGLPMLQQTFQFPDTDQF